MLSEEKKGVEKDRAYYFYCYYYLLKNDWNGTKPATRWPSTNALGHGGTFRRSTHGPTVVGIDMELVSPSPTRRDEKRRSITCPLLASRTTNPRLCACAPFHRLTHDHECLPPSARVVLCIYIDYSTSMDVADSILCLEKDSVVGFFYNLIRYDSKIVLVRHVSFTLRLAKCERETIRLLARSYVLQPYKDTGPCRITCFIEPFSSPKPTKQGFRV